MNFTSVSRIETLNKDNYDTWRIQMEALLVKNDAWGYVCGDVIKPNQQASAADIAAWEKADRKAKSDIILSINPSELKQVKGCVSSREVWLKLQTIYQSRGPARKATLLKQLTLQRLEEGNDVRDHLNRFFDAVDKLTDMEVEINPDLLAIMVLYSLPPSYENFRCAIESRDELPSPEVLRVKIVEESDARQNETRGAVQGAMFANRKHQQWRRHNKNPGNSDPKRGENQKQSEHFKYRCHKCKKIGHKASECRNKTNSVANCETDNSVRAGTSNEAFCASESYANNNESKWCLDSGATSHLCKNVDDFVEINQSVRDKLTLANSTSTEVIAKGTAVFSTDVHGETKDITLRNALHVPDLRTNLLSVGKITAVGFDVLFQKHRALVKDKNGHVKLIAERAGDLYYVREKPCSNKNSDHVSAVANDSLRVDKLMLWHRRLGHLNLRDMLSSKRDGRILGLDFEPDEHYKLNCDICFRGKMTRLPFPKKSMKTTKTLEIIHTDVCGPMRVSSKGGARYFVTFTDDASRWTQVRFIKNKSEVFKCFTEFANEVENLHSCKIKYLQSDNGGEYTSREFDDYLKDRGISRRLSVPHNPQQNGIAERKNRTLLDTARCLLLQSNQPASFWAEAINFACYIKNRSPTKTLDGRTPFEKWTGKVPDLSNLQEYGSKIYFFNDSPMKGKLEPRGKNGIFLGYSEESKGFRIWVPAENKVVISRDVKFSPNPEINSDGVNTLFDDPFPGTSEYIEIINSQPEPVTPETVIENVVVPALRRGAGRPIITRTGRRGRPRKVYKMVDDQVRRHDTNDDDQISTEGNIALISEISMSDAMSSESSRDWIEAMASEMYFIIKNNTWDIVDRPKKELVIGSRFVLRNKSDGDSERKKARLVAQGFSQRPGLHFYETFAPVARMSSIRTIVALSVQLDLKIRQFDISTAYLNGELQEKIHMELPKMLIQILEYMIQSKKFDKNCITKAEDMLKKITSGNKVCLLRKSLYGLRQAGRNWHAKLDSTLRKLGAIPCEADPCIYRLNRGEETDFIVTYVDDILFASKNDEAFSDFFKKLSKAFDVRDLGEIKNFLGIEFTRSNGCLYLSQQKYISEILNKYGMTECKMASTPLDISTKLTKSDKQNEEDKKLPYRELIGSLTYLSIVTRPDISHAISFLGQFNHCYDRSHWIAAKRVLRYLKGTMDLGLKFNKDSSPIQGFVDADWGGNLDDRRSFTGYCFLWGGSPISWDSRKQRTVALSSNEAEYMGLTDASKEAIHLKKLIGDLGIDSEDTIVIHNDNMGALKLAENPIFHARSKHIDIRYHFIRDALKNKLVCITHLSTNDMIADVLTKGLGPSKHRRFIQMMGMQNSPRSSPRGEVLAQID